MIYEVSIRSDDLLLAINNWDLGRIGLVFDRFSSFCEDRNDENPSNTSPKAGWLTYDNTRVLDLARRM